jgi:hypothetical protein
MAITHQVYIEPHALVIGLPDEHIALCHEVMGDAGLRVDVLRTALGLGAACEKIPKTLPQMVVASASLGADAVSALEDRAIAVGAVFLLLGDRPDYESMGRQLETGVTLARERFGRRSSRPPS